jgi:hypothetical protein
MKPEKATAKADKKLTTKVEDEADRKWLNEMYSTPEGGELADEMLTKIAKEVAKKASTSKKTKASTKTKASVKVEKVAKAAPVSSSYVVTSSFPLPG